MSLKEHLERLFYIVSDEEPDKYGDLILLADSKRARLTDGTESVILSTHANRIVVFEDNPRENIPGGSFEKSGIMQLLDGQATIEDLIAERKIDCRGTEEQIITFYKMLRIVLLVSARSLSAYQLWKNFKND